MMESKIRVKIELIAEDRVGNANAVQTQIVRQRPLFAPHGALAWIASMLQQIVHPFGFQNMVVIIRL